ncbi:140aa long hypothetical protein [Pyrococcus horikoshii OT3]|uniref:Uncharacterized protein n=1 Tax=Pyrococcus horikoshii (strain ATCC 700860 / DSM 12428 / JCM 9974 / NBRC 100139 / OT-3) TaxID=70601 RepID=O59311_PYRHO|nr:140aa long hypothetical protein [Pyrococcus horikoshii OT3]
MLLRPGAKPASNTIVTWAFSASSLSSNGFSGIKETSTMSTLDFIAALMLLNPRNPGKAPITNSNSFITSTSLSKLLASTFKGVANSFTFSRFSLFTSPMYTSNSSLRSHAIALPIFPAPKIRTFIGFTQIYFSYACYNFY